MLLGGAVAGGLQRSFLVVRWEVAVFMRIVMVI
jgi:hypothetical protein